MRLPGLLSAHWLALQTAVDMRHVTIKQRWAAFRYVLGVAAAYRKGSA